ncbi:protein kinase domain-containing protein, partial [Endozoicomonas ascidiicola]|uniref:protein kinase domain-containing protein n=1 Tax=Endozoicomonas ascidiicola TaxID=1698521 RepID=UPI001C12C51D
PENHCFKASLSERPEIMGLYSFQAHFGIGKYSNTMEASKVLSGSVPELPTDSSRTTDGCCWGIRNLFQCCQPKVIPERSTLGSDADHFRIIEKRGEVQNVVVQEPLIPKAAETDQSAEIFGEDAVWREAETFEGTDQALTGLLSLHQGRRLDEGGFGKVYRYFNNSGPEYAVKLAALDSHNSQTQERCDEGEVTGLGVKPNPYIGKTYALIMENKSEYVALKEESVCTLLLKASWSVSAVITELINGEALVDVVRGVVEPRAKHGFNNDVEGVGIDRRLIQLSHLTLYDLIPALEFLHGQKVVHRDIKPDNLMHFHDGKKERLKLIDFGLAKKIENGKRPTTICGTEYNSSPEQLGENGVLKSGYDGVQADLYNVGSCLACVVTGADLASLLKLYENVFLTDMNTETSPTSRLASIDAQSKRCLLQEANPHLNIYGGLSDVIVSLMENDPQSRLSLASVKRITVNMDIDFKESDE